MGKLAITGGKSYRTKPFTPWPIYDQSEIRAVTKVIKNRNWGGFPFPNRLAAEFGKAFAKTHDAKYGLCVSNGTVSLETALKAAGVMPGDEVLVPAVTWVATVSAPLMINAIPVFVDISPENWCMDPQKIEALITPHTKAIIPVHLGMQIADMDAILDIARKHNLYVIEDCAHAHGGKWRGKGTGSLGHIGSFSMQTSKLMTAGEGGIIIMSDQELEEKCESLINCGRPSATDTYKHRLIGYNNRMTEIQAAILLCQLKRLIPQNKKRTTNAKRLTQKLTRIPGIRTLPVDKRITRQNIYQYFFAFDETKFSGITRDHFVLALEREGVPCDGLFYEPVYKSPLLTIRMDEWPSLKERGIDYRGVSCPVGEKMAYRESVWMPHQLLLGPQKDVDDMAGAVAKIVENIDELRSLKAEDVLAKPRAMRKVKKVPY